MQRNRLHSLFSVARVRLCGAEAYPLHDHTFGEVAWVDAGAPMLHRVNGEKQEIAPGSFLFIRPEDQHSFHCLDEQPVFLVNICFQWHLYEGLRQRYFAAHTAVYGEEQRMPKMLQLTRGQLESARSASIALHKAPQSIFSIERFLMNLLAELCPLPENDSLSNAPEWMQRAWHLIRQPEHLRLGVSEFYRLCGRCPEHVSREFHKQTGQTVVRQIVRLKMEHAAALLATTTREIVEISRDCGFESLSHFYTCFRKAHDSSPREYRKKAQRQMHR